MNDPHPLASIQLRWQPIIRWPKALSNCCYYNEGGERKADAPHTHSDRQCRRHKQRQCSHRNHCSLWTRWSLLTNVVLRSSLMLSLLLMLAVIGGSMDVIAAEPTFGLVGTGGSLGHPSIHVPSTLNSGGVGVAGVGVMVGSETRCPRLCTCSGLAVDCSHRGLTQVPRKISADVERL